MLNTMIHDPRTNEINLFIHTRDIRNLRYHRGGKWDSWQRKEWRNNHPLMKKDEMHSRKFGALYRRSLSDRSPHPSITIWQQRAMQRVLRRFRSKKQFPKDFFWSSTPAKIQKFTGKSNHIRLPNHLRSIIRRINNDFNLRFFGSLKI